MSDDADKFKEAVDALDNLDSGVEKAKSYVGDLMQIYLDEFVSCPVCRSHSWTVPGYFNMMFETNVGLGFNKVTDNIILDDEGASQKQYVSFNDQYRERAYNLEDTTYLRPETAQGIFTNYKNVVDSFYPDLPFGIAQQGKAFRNEISPRDFVFRSREFEQMEVEYFVRPEKWEEAFEQWRKDIGRRRA